MWEHCTLNLNSSNPIHKTTMLIFKGELKGWEYDCYIHYFTTNGEVKYENLADLGEALDYNPFNRGFAKLTSDGWELVSIQHANLVIGIWGGSNYKTSTEREWNSLSNRNKVAYFKRKVE
ncbi:hypothetical protein ACFFUS_11740 [Vibrio gallaecicus]|uniref:hypothetical protein n=1 Tax=Vibrio gallaecicus TaxID=552386 RepID=UPI0010C9D002|nr:hypothetical protein [Vibrio gallaecicus]MDN3617364.1 hypothetical protein [Vibrio gallaecicus]